MPVDRSVLVAVLEAKGFKVREGDHSFYSLYVDGKKTSVFTKISHGSSYKVYSDSLLGFVKKQMSLTSEELRQYIECTISYDMYVQILKEKGRIK
jgi:trans-2-enoyl-CoA reductase